MKILAIALIAYSAVMLLIHLTSWKLLKQWNGPEESWARRWFSAKTALRVEAVYWVLILATWSLWPSAAWKAVMVVFAVIHLGVWLDGELRVIRLGALPALPVAAHRFIVAFDLVEAGALAVIAWFAVSLVLRAG